ncbi:hypothetical protein SAMN05443549_102349 [Flavobacterium fluvii]|uniref:Uncharacterized protein n=1 Tax=Flavobacterium fluvii TaxID=468056 RepID=A0A1M5HRR0_9FLAO|nr:hypothetical protein SAMN05443549_102349 [Flavobacterium fluvii]
MNTLKLIGKIILWIFTVFLIIPYSMALFMKFEEPHSKNLNTKEFIIFGIILLVLLFINHKLFSPYFKNKKS